MSILIGWESPLDQYFMAQPARLFGRPIEHATIDPAQPMVLEAHAVCAAAELPLVLTPDLDLACFSTGEDDEILSESVMPVLVGSLEDLPRSHPTAAPWLNAPLQPCVRCART